MTSNWSSAGDWVATRRRSPLSRNRKYRLAATLAITRSASSGRVVTPAFCRRRCGARRRVWGGRCTGWLQGYAEICDKRTYCRQPWETAMPNSRFPAWAALAAGMSMLVAACGGGSGEMPAAVPSPGGVGTLRVALTDAPSCGYDAVNVTIERIRVHQSPAAGDNDAGWSDLIVTPSRRINLLDLSNGVLEELGQVQLPAGHYTQMRLLLADNGNSAPPANSVKPSGGSEVALTTPSARQSGLKLNLDLDVGANQIADVVLDFDACKSVVRRGNSGHFNLKPVIAVIPRITDVGTIEGFVDPSVAAATTVSAQLGGNPVKAAPPDAVTGKFVLYPVPVGTYALVLTHPSRVTAAVINVPVVASAAPTIVGAASAPLLPPAAASAPRVVTGTVTTTPQASAEVRAVQTIASTPAPTQVEVAFDNSDDVTGGFSLTLPVSAPVWAAFGPSPTPLSFANDGAAAGLYSVRASAGGTTKSQSIDVKAAVPPLVFAFP